ncbi:MAG: prephenate dehydrogenase/arogenate dehydrogenase family protein [Tunicatimonas sp.]
MKLCIVGTGLIGSSFALGIKHRSSDDNLVVLGVDANQANATTALELGIIDQIVSLQEGLTRADVIVLAIPVDHIVASINHCLNGLPPRAVLIDMGSTKAAIAAVVREHPKRGRYVAAHPIAGREKAGPTAANHELMFHKPMLICDRERSDPDALQQAVRLFEMLRMRITYTSSAKHDRRLSYTSHLPHLLAFALSNTILAEEENTEMLDSAGGGLKSVVRLALHSAQMWTPIFVQNRDHLMEANARLINQLLALQEALENNDAEAINALIARANSIKDLLRN